MHQLPETLRDNVRLLGDLLGQIITHHEGETLFQRIEDIRNLSKSLAQAPEVDYQPLVNSLTTLNEQDILPLSRAFNQFLNLVNIADQQYYSSAETQPADNLKSLLSSIANTSSKAQLLETIQHLNVDLVLTAHPTEVSRRTLIRKYNQIVQTLGDLARNDLLGFERDKLQGRLYRLIEEVWTTDEIRVQRPTALDEAKGGMSVIEESLWRAVPDMVRHLDRLCAQLLGQHLDINSSPFTFCSWMGGDRDGNPNVTHKVTEEVVLLGRQRAADMYSQDIAHLTADLSMHAASDELWDTHGNRHSKTPYRDLLGKLNTQLQRTSQWAGAKLAGERRNPPDDLIVNRQQLLQPLLLVHRSLTENGCQHIANGPLIDTIRRINAFGINLSPIDVRQDSEQHVNALDELTLYLDLGSYKEWSEAQRIEFLSNQLKSKRPLFPLSWPKSDETQEVLDTCRVISEQPREVLSHYVISMAKHASDVLAVALLLRESGITWNMPVVPLFETLDDLNRAPQVMNTLWQMHWYQEYTEGQETVMIGYSDSAKDAGKLAATWAQYQAQEKLVALAEQYEIKLTLFHGRGGTVGRGGGPVEKAMASQPPGSVKGRIRVTEQGEMIRYKFGVPQVAFNSLRTYVSATLTATLAPSPLPKAEWRELIEEMAQRSLKAYRAVIRENALFVPYFRSLTPEQELSKLAIGSRPARRKANGGVESLRAIPWVFAWMQVRLNLPSWLGVYEALNYAVDEKPALFNEMLEHWPFFSSFLELLEMVLGKADVTVCEHYEQQLVQSEHHPLGQQLRENLQALQALVNNIKGQNELLENDAHLQLSINVRKPYVDPLNYLQAELLKRERLSGDMSEDLERALKVTMAGISAGMRNTG